MERRSHEEPHDPNRRTGTERRNHGWGSDAYDDKRHERHHESALSQALLEEGPFGKWFSWGHIAVTLGMCSFMFSLWSNYKKDAEVAAEERLRLEARIVILETSVTHLTQVDKDQLAGLEKEITSVLRGQTAQREDIRILQQYLLNQHQRGGGR